MKVKVEEGELEKTKKILVIEDEKPMANALKLKLESSGFDTKVVFNGEDAIKFIVNDRFDCILTDLIMPKMDGFELLKKIKGLKIETPVIVLSNLSLEDDKIKAKEMGAVDYIVKSDTPIIEIIDRIKEIVER